MTFELPLFPLNVVLFPGMQLPLHIFEPRYRLMARRCLEQDATFGVALLIEGDEGQSNTLPSSIGCSAEIIENTPFPDGRLNLLTVGRRRFQILSLREQDDYWIGTCQWLDDDEAPEAETIERAARVRGALSGYLKSLTRNAGLSPADVAGLQAPHDPYELSMWVGTLITLPNDQKQELLEMTSTPARLEIEHVFLRRGEIVQRAYTRRSQERTGAEIAADEDDFSGPFSQFLSLN